MEIPRSKVGRLVSILQICMKDRLCQVQRTMLELLNQLDGFESSSNIKVFADLLI